MVSKVADHFHHKLGDMRNMEALVTGSRGAPMQTESTQQGD